MFQRLDVLCVSFAGAVNVVKHDRMETTPYIITIIIGSKDNVIIFRGLGLGLGLG